MHPDWGPPAEVRLEGADEGAPRGDRHPRPLRDHHVCAVHGVVTATEAAAVSCFLGYAICLARRKLTWKKFVDSMTDTLRISCMVFMIVAGAVIFARFLTLTRLPFAAAEWIQALALPKWMVLW